MLEISSEEPFVRIEVRNPRTHISREKALYTDYEILVKTNNIAFSCNESCVRRRYSDFQWLKKRLITLYKWVTTPPELPPKRLFGRFQRQFLKRRQLGLQNFLERIVEDNQYLSDVAIHLFLQSSLPIKEIERHLDGMTSDGDILDSLQSRGKGRQSAISRSMTEMPLDKTEACLEHDSGCCYSTTSSINDLMHTPVTKTREEWRYYMSLPANLDKVDVNESENNTLDQSKQNGVLSQVDSGHLTSDSHQSLNKGTSESDCDSMCSVDYDADYESNVDDESVREYETNTYSLFELDKRFRMEQALTLLRSRPKISERVLSSDESDEEFHESEYDVIDSHDEIDNDTLRRKVSAHKKKIGRSLSDVVKHKRKTTRSESRDHNNKNGSEERYGSMPNIRAHAPLRLSKSLSCGTKSLSSHREEDGDTERAFPLERVFPCERVFPRESPTTSSSMGKGKSDDADESVVPNSELDCYSTWNTPSKIKKFFIDSSDVDLSFDNSNEFQPEKNVARRLLERLTFNRRSPRVVADKPTLVSGRFRVSVIREEENSSRRGSASSTDLTLKFNSGASTEKQRHPSWKHFGRPITSSPESAFRYLNFDEKEDLNHLAIDTHCEKDHSGVKQDDFVDEACQNIRNESTQNTEDESEEIVMNLNELHTGIKNYNVPSLCSLASAVLPPAAKTTAASQCNIIQSEEAHDPALDSTLMADSIEAVESCLVSIEENCNAEEFTNGNTPLPTKLSENNCVRNPNKLMCNNFEALTEDCCYSLKERSVSPMFFVLKTYDVIPEIPCCLEDYEILDGNRGCIDVEK